MNDPTKHDIYPQGNSIIHNGLISMPSSVHPTSSFNVNTGGDMAIDLHTTAELVESFDIDEFMEAVDSVRSTATITPQMRDQDSTSDGSDDMVDDCGSDAPIAAHDEETKKKPRRARRVTSKEHILKLREIVKQLTKQLDALKTETRPGVQSNATKDGRLIRSSGTSLWMQAALRQRERRRKAEADNDSLREMLQMQIEEASCLKRILKRRAKIKLMEDMLGFPSPISPPLSIMSAPEDNSHIFQKILNDCDELYVGVDKALAESGLNAVPCPGQKRRVKRNTINGNFLDLMVRSRVPFNFRNTTKAVWIYLGKMVARGQETAVDFSKRVDNHFQHSEESWDTMVCSFFAATPFAGEVSGAQLCKVTRKYIEECRGVFICRTFMEPKLNEASASTGFQFRTTLKIVVDSDSQQTPSSDYNTCQIRIHFTASRRDLGLPNSARFRGPSHVDMGISVWDALISRIPDEIENFLIDDAREQMNF